MRVLSAGCVVVVSLAVALAAGCSGSGSPSPVELASADAHLFAPLPIPADFDRARARLRLAEIPDDPPAPVAGDSRAATELPQAAVRHLAEARRLFAEHRYTETILELEKVLSYDPNCQEGHRMMAVARLLSGNDNRARLSAQRALAIKPDDLTCHYVLGRLADKAGQPDKALRAYRIALKCKSTEEEAGYRVLTHYRLGVLLEQESYHAAAIAQFAAFESGLQSSGKKVEENPELASIARIHRGSAAIRVARSHGLLGNYRAAAEALKIATAHSPKDFDLRVEYVRMLVRAKRIAEAAAEAARFVSDSHGSREAVTLLLAVHRFAGRPEAGAAAMKEIIAQQPDNIDLWLLYADALLAAHQSAEAVQTLNNLVVKHPAASEVRWKLIGLHRSREDWRAWLRALTEALVVEPAEYIRAAQETDRAPAAVSARIVDEKLDQRGDKRELIPAAATDASAAALDYLLGRLCDRLDRVDDARRFFEQSVRRSPDFLPGTIGVAELYIQRCQWDDAIRVIETAGKQRDEPSHQLQRLLGQCYDGLDDVEQAVAHYERAIQIHRADARSMLLLGELYERQGEPRKARQQYQAAIAANPDNVLAREAYIRSLLYARDESTRAVGRVSLEFAEMQRRAPNDPATGRCSALLTFVQDSDRDAYCRRLKGLIRAHPDDLRSRVELATTLMAFRDYEEARLELTEILARDPRSPRAGELMAIVLTKLLDFEQAAEQFQRLLTLYPNRGEWVRNFAELHLIDQDYDAAVGLWKRFLSLQKRAGLQGTAYRGRLMEACRLAGRFDEARQIAEGWLEETDSNDLARNGARWFLLAADQAEQDYDRYLERCRQWLRAVPNDREIRGWLLGVSMEAPLGVIGRFEGRGGLIGAGRFDEALLQVLEWLAETPEDATVIRWQMEVLQSARRYDEAIELSRSLLATVTQPEERFVRLYVLQMTYARARRYDEAIATAKEAIATAHELVSQIDSTRGAGFEEAVFSHRRGIGSLLTQAGRFDQAIAHLNKMIEETGDEQHKADLLRAVAYVYQRQGRMALAEERLRESYELAPTDIGLNNDLGYTLADMGKELEEAERMIRLAVGEAPREPAYLDSLGWVLYKRGRLDEARTWLTRAASQQGGKDPVIFDHLGDVEWRLGETVKAVQTWRRSLENYERRWADGETETNQEFVTRISGKLKAATSGETPAVAPVVGE